MLSGMVTAQAQNQIAGSPEDIKTLHQLNKEHANAFATGNSEVLANKILSEDFILIATDGNIYRKKEVIQQVVNSKSEVKNIASHELEDVIVRFVASDVAMVHAVVKFKYKDGKNSSAVRYNDIYAKRNGKWECVSGNNSPVTN